MRTHTVAVVLVVAAAIIAIVSHPRVVFGDGTAMSIVSLDGPFFMAQWLALVLSILALVFSVLAILSGTGSKSILVAAVATTLVAWLVMTGVPHPANSGEWYKRELGLGAFMRGYAKRRAENTPPPTLTASSFAGQWQAIDGTSYSFGPDRVSWSGGEAAGEYSAAACAGEFRLAYVERTRDLLQDLGFTWSTHAIARFDSTALDARIPVAEVACGPGDRIVFIKAGADEVWRWTNSLELDAIKSGAFVLRRASDSR
jgi:hypothetical protein